MSVKCQCEKRENSPKSRWGGFILVLIFCWGGTEWNCETLHKQKTPRCLACKAIRPKSQKIHKSQGAKKFFRKKTEVFWAFVLSSPWNFWGNAPIFEEHIVQRETWSHQLVLFLAGQHQGKKVLIAEKYFQRWPSYGSSTTTTGSQRMWCLGGQKIGVGCHVIIIV